MVWNSCLVMGCKHQAGFKGGLAPLITGEGSPQVACRQMRLHNSTNDLLVMLPLRSNIVAGDNKVLTAMRSVQSDASGILAVEYQHR